MMIDVNVNLGRWPFRRLAGDDTPRLVEKLRSHDVVEAWAGSFEGLLHKDLTGVNTRLAEECRRHGEGFLVPFGSVNPKAPDWEEELRRCHEQQRMPGIRLHPDFHGYKLDDPAFARLLALATERKLIVQLVLKMEDERTQHPLLRLPAVDVSPLPGLVARFPELRLVILNGLFGLRSQIFVPLVRAGQVYVEISMLEGAGGVARLTRTLGSTRILFGSHFPLFYLESALLKMREAALKPDEAKPILHDNARRLLPKA